MSDLEKKLKQYFYNLWIREGGLTSPENQHGKNVAIRWRDFESFKADVGPFRPGCYIARIDSKLPLGPKNWCWTTVAAENRKRVRRTDRLTPAAAYKGCVMIFSGYTNLEIGKHLGCDSKVISEIRTGRTWRKVYAQAHERVGRLLG